MEYLIKQYGLQQGALEIQYIEEYFLDFPRKKTAAEVVGRLRDWDHQILMAEASVPEEPSMVMPVSFKVAHELRGAESDPQLADLVAQLDECVEFDGRRVLYQWIGGTRSDWRGQGHFRALTEEQESWAIDNGFDEIVVKTKNRFYEMRSTLAQLNFDVIRFVQHPVDPSESKVFLSKRLGQHVLDAHRSRRTVTRTVTRVIEPVSTPDDPRLAPYAHVGDPGWLRDRHLFVAEGRLVVERLLAAERYPIESLLVTPTAASALAILLEQVRVPVLVGAPDIIRHVTGFDFHRGCLALARREGPEAPGWTELAASRGPVLGLEGVANPDNVGGLFRTAAAFGAAGILAGPGTADPLYRKAVRTSMGAVLQLPWCSIGAWDPVLSTFKAAGFHVVALTPHADAVPIERALARCHGRVVLLVGSEGAGLAAGTLAAADERVRIPIASGVDSLNVVVAAGIALHAAAVPLRELP